MTKQKMFETAARNLRNRTIKTSQSVKMFNLHAVSEMLDQIITELAEFAGEEPELKAAIGTVLAAKRLIKTYSDRTLDTPYKSLDMNGLRELTSFIQSFAVLGEETSKFIDKSNITDTFDNKVSVEMYKDALEKLLLSLKEISEIEKEQLGTVEKSLMSNPRYLLKAKSHLKLLNSFKGNYDRFESEGAGFDSASTIFDRQVQKRRDKETQDALDEYDKQHGNKDRKRDKNGRFS